MCLREATTHGRSLLSLEAFKKGQHLLTKKYINTHTHTHTMQGKDLLIWDSQKLRCAWGTWNLHLREAGSYYI